MSTRNPADARAASIVAVLALTACSGGATSSTPLALRPPIPATSAPANTSSSTRATFVVHWPAAGQAVRRRNTISASTQSISVSVDGGVATVVNKPTISGNPSSSSVTIPAPAGNDSFTFTAWDEANGTGNVLDQSTTTQDIIADANNVVSVVLDAVCAALVPTLATSNTYAETTNVTTPLTSGSRTILKSARLVGNFTQSFAFTPVDADGNTILTGAGSVPISVTESGPTPHVTIAANAVGAANTLFNVTPLVAEADGFSTQLTASSPNCGSGTAALPNSFTLSTSADIVVADYSNGIFAFDQDGAPVAKISSTQDITGISYNAKSNYLVAIETGTNHAGTASPPGVVAFQTLSLAGASIGSGYFTPTGTTAANDIAANLAYNPISGFFVVATNGSDGSLQNVAISGSTATLQNSQFSGTKYSASVVVLPNGNVMSADDDSDDISLFNDNGDAIESLNQGAVALAVDTLRGTVLYENANGSGFSGGIITTTPSEFSLNGTFSQPSSYYDFALAYNQAVDELYMFSNEGPATGLSGTTVYSGGSAVASNLPSGAFSSLRDPTQAVVIP